MNRVLKIIQDKTQQDRLWEQYQYLMGQNQYLSQHLQSLVGSLTPIKRLTLFQSTDFLEMGEKERDIIFKIKEYQKRGRRRFYLYFSVKETNKKLIHYIILKTKHNSIVEKMIAIVENVLKAKQVG